MTSPLLALGDEQFVLLTTFRKTGDAVATPVWIARDGESLVVTTPAGSGKLKRLKNNPRVTLQPCGRLGKPKDGSPIVEGAARSETDDTVSDEATAALRKKYGVEFTVILGAEKLASRDKRDRVILRITES